MPEPASAGGPEGRSSVACCRQTLGTMTAVYWHPTLHRDGILPRGSSQQALDLSAAAGR